MSCKKGPLRILRNLYTRDPLLLCINYTIGALLYPLVIKIIGDEKMKKIQTLYKKKKKFNNLGNIFLYFYLETSTISYETPHNIICASTLSVHR